MSTSQYSDLYFGHYTTVKGNTWDFGTSKLTNIAEPLVSTDVSTKNYVDYNRQQQGQNLRAYADAGDLTVSNAYKAADVSLKAAVDAEIAAVQAQVDSILAGADVNTDSLKEIADLAKTLNTSETASLISSVASLQSQITSNDSDISDLKALTTSYSTEFDTALIVMPTLEIKDKQWGNGLQNDSNGNLFINCPTPNGSAIICSKDTWFQTDFIGTTSFPNVKFINPIDLQGNAIKSIADGTSPQDAVSFSQYSALQSRVLVLEGQLAALYQYLYNSSPTVTPVR